MTRTVVGAMIAGLATGVFGLIIACVATLAIAFTTRSSADLPGIFHAEFVVIDGAPQIGFLPDLGGMGIALLVWTVLAGLLGVVLARGARARREREGSARVEQ
ncbi:MAG: hypothetical protein DI534_06075 [Leifsonia xyli]|nr:MAG: hypothetical protein DI534_06075 [Leifsonia xyli]